MSSEKLQQIINKQQGQIAPGGEQTLGQIASPLTSSPPLHGYLHHERDYGQVRCRAEVRDEVEQLGSKVRSRLNLLNHACGSPHLP